MSREIEYQMNFDEFCNYVKAHIVNYLPDEFASSDIRVMDQIPRSSGEESTALLIRKDGTNAAPALYLEKYFADYQEGGIVGDVMAQISYDRISYDYYHIDEPFVTVADDFVHDWNLAKERVIFSVVGSSLRGDSLESRPYKSMGGDITAIYNIDLGDIGNGQSAVIPVSNSLQQFWGVSTEELHDCALKNTPERRSVRIEDMDNILQGYGFMSPAVGSVVPLTVITNNIMTNGAAALFYPGVLEQMNEKYPDGFAILPSSVHEVIIAPASSPEEVQFLSDTVRDINADMVSMDERLSDFAHVYDAKTHSISAPEWNLRSVREDVLSYSEVKAIAEGNVLTDEPYEMNRPVISERNVSVAGGISDSEQTQDTKKHDRYASR